MAKAKKSAKKPDLSRQQEAAANRKRKFPRVEFNDLLGRIDHVRGAIAGSVEVMDEAGITELEVDGATKAKRALDELKLFSLNVEVAIKKAKPWP